MEEDLFMAFDQRDAAPYVWDSWFLQALNYHSKAQPLFRIRPVQLVPHKILELAPIQCKD